MRTKQWFTLLLVLISSVGLAQHTYRSHWNYVKDVYTKADHAFTTKSVEKDLEIKRYPVSIECFYPQFVDSTGRGKTWNDGLKNLLDQAAQDGPIFQTVLGKLKVAWPWFMTQLLADYNTWNQPDVDYTDAELQEIKVHPLSITNGNLFVDVRFEFGVRIGRRDEELAFSIPYWISKNNRDFEHWTIQLSAMQLAAVKEEVLSFLEPKIEYEKGHWQKNKKPKGYPESDHYYDETLTPIQQFFLRDNPDLETWMDWKQIELIPFAWGVLFRFPEYSPSSYTLNEEYLGGFISFESMEPSTFRGSPLSHFSALRLNGSTKNFQEFDHKIHRTLPYKVEMDYLDLAQKNDVRKLTIHHKNKDKVHGSYLPAYKEELIFDKKGNLIEVNRTNGKGKITQRKQWFYGANGELEKFLLDEVGSNTQNWTLFEYDAHHNQKLLRSANHSEFTGYDQNIGYRFSMEGEFRVPQIRRIIYQDNSIVYETFTEFFNQNHQLIAVGAHSGASRTVQLNRNENGQILESYTNGDREQKFWEYDSQNRLVKYHFQYDRTTHKFEWEYHEDDTTNLPNRATLHQGHDQQWEFQWETFGK